MIYKIHWKNVEYTPPLSILTLMKTIIEKSASQTGVTWDGTEMLSIDK